jgi:hypothetical protein
MTYLFFVFIILLIPTSSALNTQAEVKIVAINDAIFISSHWDGQEILEDGTIHQSFRPLKIIEDETYTANITVKNVGRFLYNTNVTITFIYSGISIDVRGEIGSFEFNNEVSISIPNLPAPEFMDWGLAHAIFNWESHDRLKSYVEYQLKVDIVPYAKNFKTKTPDWIIEDSHKSQVDGQFSLLSKPAEIKKIWEGSESTHSNLEKKEGPKLRVRIKFNENVNYFYLTVTVKGDTHNGWISSNTRFYSGGFSTGSTIVFSIDLDWIFPSAKYSFGQGYYKFESARIFSWGWSDIFYNNPYTSRDEFRVNQSGNEDRVVFLSVIFDSYMDSNNNCLDYHPIYYIGEATYRFKRDIKINYHINIKQIDWLNSDRSRDGWNCKGEWGTKHSSNLVDKAGNHKIFEAAAKGQQTALGLRNPWEGIGSRYNSQKNNHGFDQALALTGLFRGQDSEHNGAVGRAFQPGNLAWVTAGTETKQWIGWGYTYLDNTSFTNVIQHEMSHNWNATHDNYKYNVMYPDVCDDSGCTLWRQKAKNEINNNRDWFAYWPTN